MFDVYVPGVTCKLEKCPICGEELIIIDNINYFTLICKKCHTTVFEEFDGTFHFIKNGIASDGYDVSLDIFEKTILSDTLNTCEYDEFDKHDYFLEKLFEGEVVGIGIYHPDIFNYFTERMETFKQKLRDDYIYFKGYEKYWERNQKTKDMLKEDIEHAWEVVLNK